MIAVDTNVIAYLLIPGDRTPQAEDVFSKDREWAAPPLWRSELRNVLSLYIRKDLITLENAKELMEQAEMLVSDVPAVASGGVLDLASSSGCSAYDCEFVATAQTIGVPLITSDLKIRKAFPAVAVSMLDFVEKDNA